MISGEGPGGLSAAGVCAVPAAVADVVAVAAAGAAAGAVFELAAAGAGFAASGVDCAYTGPAIAIDALMATKIRNLAFVMAYPPASKI
jgi:hypothetical protein